MDRYPEIEPYEHGLLDVGDGQHLYWEACGNPQGKPALVVHGGPGSGCGSGARRLFDPSRYRVVLFDQRGCGRSTPHASDPHVDLSTNTTQHLLADMQRLREHLGIERWLIFGGSWGAVLGLRYAQLYPHRVSEIVLTCVATGRQVEVDLLVRGLGKIYPQEWARFHAGAGAVDGGLADAYHRLLRDPDPAIREKAARDWCEWEEAIVPSEDPNPRFADPEYRMAFACLVTHYWRHGSWLDEGVVLREANRLAGIPGVIVQGVLDLGNLVGTPWLLANAWPDSELLLVGEGGHGLSGSGMTAALIAATNRFAT